MSLTVFKYPLLLKDHSTVNMPVGAEILSIQTQYNQLCIWALVDTNENRQIARRFRIAGTGRELEVERSRLKFLATVQFSGGAIVFHVFEVDG